MPNYVRRLRTALFDLVRRPATYMVAIIGSVTVLTSICAAMLVPGIPWTAFGSSVSFGARPPSTTLCRSSEVVYVGEPISVLHNQHCGLLQFRINIANAIGISSSPPPAPSHDAQGPSIRPHANSKVSPRQSIIKIIGDARAQSRATVNTIASRVWLALGLWCIAGLLAALMVAWAILSMVNLGVKLLNWTFKLAAIVIGRVLRRSEKPWFTVEMLSGGVKIAITILVAAVWVGCAVQALSASSSWNGYTSITQLVGSQAVHLVPPPAGNVDTADNAAVMGHSVVALYGGEDSAGYCWQSADSLANQLTQMFLPATGPPVWRFKNLACSGATIPQGLLGPQLHGSSHGTIATPSQVGQLKRMPNLGLVVVYIGANDVGLPGLAKTCVATGVCSDNFSYTDFQMKLKAYTFNFNSLLEQLSNLPTHPRIVVNLNYYAMDPASAESGNTCPDAIGLNPADIQQLNDYTWALNNVTTAGVQAYMKAHPGGIALASPQLRELCETTGRLGPEIQPVWTKAGKINPYAFHPTDVGERRIGEADHKAIQDLFSDAPNTTTVPSP